MAKTQGKSAKLAGILILGILLIAPLLFLQRLLDQLAAKDESRLEILARERLINEMEDCLDGLKPDKYIEKALEELNFKFGFKSPDGQQRELNYPAGYDPELIGPDFIDRTREFLKLNFNIKPFLIVAADCDLQHSYFWTAVNIFPSQAARDLFVEAAVNCFAFVENNPKNQLPGTPDLAVRKFEFLKKYISIENTSHQIFSKLFRDHVSVFADPSIYPGRSVVFFSNKFGNQRSYQVFYRITRGVSPRESLLGLYYCCFNSCDIPPATMLKNAMRRSSTQVERHVSRRQVQRPFFHLENGRYYYLAGFPTFFHTSSEDYGVRNPQTRLKLLDFLQNHCLVTSIDAAFLVSDYRKAAAMNGAAVRMSLLMLLALAVKMMSGFSMGGVKLSNKLRLAVAMAVMLPVSGFFLVCEMITSGSEKLALFNSQMRIRQRLAFFEKLCGENDPRLLMMYQEFKKEFTSWFFDRSNSPVNPALRNGTYRNFSIANLSLFLDRDGEVSKIYNQGLYAGHKNEISGLFRILSELDAINRGSRVIQDLQKQQLFLASFTDTFWDIFATGNILAGESLLTKNFLSVSALKRSCYQLIASPATPNSPEAIIFSEVGDNNLNGRLLRQLRFKAPQLFSDYSESHQIDYGMFLRSPTSLRDIQVPRSGPGMGILRKIANKALEKQTSGTSVNREKDQMVITSWVYFDDLPIIMTARGVVKNHPGRRLLFFILPLILLIYAVAAIGLLSESLAEALLAPVQTLLAFVKSIQNGVINVRAEIKSGDEFGELAVAFNRMSNGLCQREKMRRFVSEKLYASLESPLAEKNSGRTSVTILSSDIRSFTTISEQHQPEEVVSLLNDYFSLMETAITANGGSIEKIIGDAVLAAFYHEENSSSHAVRACQAALGMKKLLVEFNRMRLQENKFTIETGIGLATGEAVLGFAGSSSGRREFVLLGEVIQNAEQLESLTRNGTSSRIFADRTTVELAADRIAFCEPTDENGSLYYRELKNEQ